MDTILIVGAGPTGLMAALTLAHLGMTPRIIDQRTNPISTSNALAIQPRTLEIWEEIGLTNDALAEGHQLKGITLSNSNHLIAQINLKDLPSKYPFILSLPQVKTEKLLTAHLSTYGISIERGVVLDDLTVNNDDVKVVCNGKTEHYSWVIGCDGTNSTVRKKAGIQFKGNNLPQHFIMADTHINWDKNPSFGHVIFSREGPLVFFPFNNKNFGRLIIDVTGDTRLKKEKKPVFKDFQRLMQTRNKQKASLEASEWISSFWVHSKIADSYRKGRLFLAGDAAHQHSPFGGQGMNTGLQDAYFLANHLADYIQNTQSANTLANYEKVRRPIGKSIVRRTDIMTRIVSTRFKLLQTLRNALLPFLLRIPLFSRKAIMTLTQLIYR